MYLLAKHNIIPRIEEPSSTPPRRQLSYGDPPSAPHADPAAARAGHHSLDVERWWSQHVQSLKKEFEDFRYCIKFYYIKKYKK